MPPAGAVSAVASDEPTFIYPSTSNFEEGLVVPIPTLPAVYTASVAVLPSINFPPPLPPEPTPTQLVPLFTQRDFVVVS